MPTRSRFTDLFRGKIHPGILLRRKPGLISLAALLSIVTLGGFLAANARSIDALYRGVELQGIAVSGKIPVIVGEFDTLIWGANAPSGIAYNTSPNQYAVVDRGT